MFCCMVMCGRERICDRLWVWLTEIVSTETETGSNTVSGRKMAWSGAAGIGALGSVFFGYFCGDSSDRLEYN